MAEDDVQARDEPEFLAQAGPPDLMQAIPIQAGPPLFQAGPPRRDYLIQAGPPRRDLPGMAPDLRAPTNQQTPEPNKPDPFIEEQKNLAEQYEALLHFHLVVYYHPMAKGNFGPRQRNAEGVQISNNTIREGSQKFGVWTSSHRATNRTLSEQESQEVMEFIESQGMLGDIFWEESDNRKPDLSNPPNKIRYNALGPVSEKIALEVPGREFIRVGNVDKLSSDSRGKIKTIRAFVKDLLRRSKTYDDNSVIYSGIMRGETRRDDTSGPVLKKIPKLW